MIKGHFTILRAIETTDLSQLLEWRNLPELRKYFREYRELNYEQQLSWFHNKVNGDLSTRMFAIDDLQGNLLGSAGLCYIDWVNRTADFSIYIGRDKLYIDNVLAPDAAKSLVKYGFDTLGLNRLWSEIYSFDAAKVDLFNALGFSLDGRHRQTHWAEGYWHDSFFFSLLTSDAQP